MTLVYEVEGEGEGNCDEVGNGDGANNVVEETEKNGSEINGDSEANVEEDDTSIDEDDTCAENEEGNEYRNYVNQDTRDQTQDSSEVLSDYESDDNLIEHDDCLGFWDENPEGEWIHPMSKYMDTEEYEVPEAPGEKIMLKVGQIFSTVDKFREVLRDYVIQEGFHLVRVKNERTRITCKCGDNGCSWRIHASPLPDGVTFSIKTLNSEHRCVRVSKTREATSTWMAHKLIGVLRENPEMKSAGIKNELQKYGLAPAYLQLYRAKMKALEMIEGSHASSYSLLPSYAEMIQKTNPGSIVKIQCNLPEVEGRNEVVPNIESSFKRIFIGLEPLKIGFLTGCNPFLGFDGCHLKGPYGGVLLAATSLDGDNGIFPVAWAVVESECKESWMFFFECLSEMLEGFTRDKHWTFMSDRQKGLMECIAEMVPCAINRRCARHIFANFIKAFPKKKLRKYFWSAARSYNVARFREAMNKIKDLDTGAHKYLVDIGESLWARHAYPTELKNDHITNNFAESFNSWINELRFKPVLTLLDGLRSKVMMRLSQKLMKAQKWSNKLTPNILKKANFQMECSRRCNILVSSSSLFEVREAGTNYIVDLHAKTCDCRIWDLSGIPCRHVCLAISHNRDNVENFTDKSFFTSDFLNAYSNVIKPVPDPKFWPTMSTSIPNTLLPPPLRRLPGRPKKNRRREQEEGRSSSAHKRSYTLKCGFCGKFGHNRRRCQRAEVGSQSSQRRNKQPNENSGRKRRTGCSTSRQETVGDEIQPPEQEAYVPVAADEHMNDVPYYSSLGDFLS